MAKNRDIANTIGDTKFGTSMSDLADGDFARGHFNAEPEGDYEHSLEPKPKFHWDLGDEAEGDPGFVHRPTYKGDVERN